MTRAIPVILYCFFLIGCQSTPEVVRVAPGRYTISRSSAAGAFANMSKLRTELLKQADEFATRQGGIAVPVGEVEISRPPVGFPSATYTFQVVDPVDYARIERRDLHDLDTLTPAQRVAVLEANRDRKSYDYRTGVMSQPQETNVNVRGSVRQDTYLNGTLQHNVSGGLYLR